jgi:hypothetical protein
MQLSTLAIIIMGINGCLTIYFMYVRIHMLTLLYRTLMKTYVCILCFLQTITQNNICRLTFSGFEALQGQVFFSPQYPDRL